MGQKRVRTHKTFDRWLKEGRGQGVGAEYKPWYTVRDVPSTGNRHRELGAKTERDHHLMSDFERWFFLICDWKRCIIDIREQYPHLSLEDPLYRKRSIMELLKESLDIARDLGYRHHTIPGNADNEPDVPTTDAVLTVEIGGKEIIYARTIKPAIELADPRVLQKFEIERRWWLSRGVDWGIVTEYDINIVLAKNIAWVHPYMCGTDGMNLSNDRIHRVATVLTQMVVERDRTLSETTDRCDDRLGLPYGSSLMVTRHLIATRQWTVDMASTLLDPCTHIPLLGVALTPPDEYA